MTVVELGKRTGLRPSTITRLEIGDHLPTHETAQKIEEALELPYGSLVFGDAAKHLRAVQMPQKHHERRQRRREAEREAKAS